MKAVLQRVTGASVRVDGRAVAAISRGLLVLAGAADGDNDDDVDWLARKIVNLRIFDRDGKFQRSLIDSGGAVLLVSQFTLLGSTRKGRRPSFTGAAAPEPARRLLERLAARIAELGPEVATGRFGANMEVESINDGPVTILLDSRDRLEPRRAGPR